MAGLIAIGFLLFHMSVTGAFGNEDCDLGLQYEDVIPYGMVNGLEMQLSTTDPLYCMMVRRENGHPVWSMPCDEYFRRLQEESG